MSDTEELKESSIPEVVGLDDDDLDEENKGKNQETTGSISPLKRFLIPVAIGVASLALALVAASFFSGTKEETQTEAVEEAGENESGRTNSEQALQDSINWLKELAEMAEKETAKKKTEPSHIARVDQMMADMEADYYIMQQQNELAFDTEAVMAELGFLDYIAEQEGGKEGEGHTDGSEGDTTADGMSVQDSVDTLNWLQKEMKKLADEETTISRQRAELENERKQLEATKKKVDRAIARIERAESAQVANVARLYDSMRPDAVAELFKNLEDKVVLKILPRMKSANAAKILGLMPPKRAARISTKMITVLD